MAGIKTTEYINNIDVKNRMNGNLVPLNIKIITIEIVTNAMTGKRNFPKISFDLFILTSPAKPYQ